METFLTSEWVHQLWRLHVVQVGGSVPRGRHNLFAPHQPIGGDHHALVAAQSRGRHADRGTVVRTLDIAVGLVLVRKVHVVFAGSLLLSGQGGARVLEMREVQTMSETQSGPQPPRWCLRWCQQRAAESAAAPCISRCELSGLRRLRRREKARRTIRAKTTALKECHKTVRNTEI